MKYKYPGGVLKNNELNISSKHIIYGNRGMDLESDINQSNTYYNDSGIALIYKKPTPIKVQDVKYTSHGVLIEKAFFESPSTTDYNGVYKGCYIDFEAKETKSSTSFPLKNIHAHQIKHMMGVIEHGGICFLIVRFTKLNITYLLRAEYLKEFLDNNKEIRASIPLSYFEEYGKVISDGYMPRLDYLKIVDEIYGGVLNGKK